MEYESIVLTGILGTSIFWIIRTVRRDRKEKKEKDEREIKVSLS